MSKDKLIVLIKGGAGKLYTPNDKSTNYLKQYFKIKGFNDI